VNTPAHAIVNLWLLGRRDKPRLALPILLGGILPDLPIVLFYAWEKVRGVPERVIWSQHYFAPGSQVVADIGHAIPLLVLGYWLARRLHATRSAALLTSMMLHALVDLPLHHDDAHRHLWPLSSWRFASPISYWDPAHGGRWATLAEIVLVLVGSAVLLRRFESRGIRIAIAAIATLYATFFAFVIVVWLR